MLRSIPAREAEGHGARTKSGYISFLSPVSSFADRLCEYQGGQVDHTYYHVLIFRRELDGSI